MKDNIPTYILVHCSAYPAASVDRLKTIDALHKERGFDLSTLGYYVGYHMLLTGGRKYRTRTDLEHGDHCNDVNLAGKPGYLFPDHQSLNFHSLSICVDFDGDTDKMPVWAEPMLKEQVQAWMKQYNIPLENVRFHRDFTTLKTCPGTGITRAYIEKLVALPKPAPTPAPAPAPVPTPPAPVPVVVDPPEVLQQKISLLQTLISLLQELLFIKKGQQTLSASASMNDQNMPAWYLSTQGPQLSATLKFLALLLIPTLKDLFGVQIGSDTLDHLIDALLIIGFGLGALVAHIRAKKTLQAKVKVLRTQVESVGSMPRA